MIYRSNRTSSRFSGAPQEPPSTRAASEQVVPVEGGGMFPLSTGDTYYAEASEAELRAEADRIARSLIASDSMWGWSRYVVEAWTVMVEGQRLTGSLVKGMNRALIEDRICQRRVDDLAVV
ncbi:MAG: hypothetical protein GEU73_05130 [Chloroflexi bacterium]|nr:hypothetical protein [Chloroflexota bacterium]